MILRGGTQSRKTSAYLESTREIAVSLHRIGKSVAELANIFEVSEREVLTWIKAKELADQRRSFLLNVVEGDELHNLRQENLKLRRTLFLRLQALENNGRLGIWPE